MRYLVVGNALPETIVRSEDGAKRLHISGVGAIMARELALAGAQTTLLSTAPAGAPTQEIEHALNRLGVIPVIVPGSPPQAKASRAVITTRNGGPIRARGSWPSMGRVMPEFAHLIRQHEWTLVSLTLVPEDLQEIRRTAHNLSVNATSVKLAQRLPTTGPLRAAAMNEQESKEIMARLGLKSRLQLPQALRAQTTMVTLGRKGWEIHQQAEPVQKSPAVPVPTGTDFIGAGDAATAALVMALAEGLDPRTTINQAISSLLKRNAQAYQNE